MSSVRVGPRRAALALAGSAIAALALTKHSERAHAQDRPGNASEIIISVPGVPGPYCVYGIDKRVRDLAGIAQVDLLWPEEKIRVVLAPGSSTTAADVRRAVERSEYPYHYTVTP
ncbi:MAG: hypothetical protein ACR2M1_09860 [Gemmatimonadaceae bacterium]